MKRIIIKYIFILFISSNLLLSQYRNSNYTTEHKIDLTENFIEDFKNNSNLINKEELQSTKNKYSPLFAGLYSAIIPGAGQFYTERYWQSIAFIGAEAFGWILYAIYEKKGDRHTDIFQNYADDYWSVIKYARWIEMYYGYSAADIIKDSPPDNVAQPWKYVDWSKLNYYEEEIGKQAHSGFSHKLAPYRDQQYYEMIGKYAQFIGGWNDAWNGSNSLYGKDDVFNERVSPNFLKYRDMRGDANSFYNIATTVSYVILANHIFSALEAAWSASKINNKLKLKGHIQPRTIYGNLVEYVPTLHARYEF